MKRLLLVGLFLMGTLATTTSCRNDVANRAGETGVNLDEDDDGFIDNTDDDESDPIETGEEGMGSM